MKIQNKDLEKLAQAFFENLQCNDECGLGGIGLDDKRPFGNSDIEEDILEIIGAKMKGDDGGGECWSSKQRDYARAVYAHLIPYLQRKYIKK